MTFVDSLGPYVRYTSSGERDYFARNKDAMQAATSRLSATTAAVGRNRAIKLSYSTRYGTRGAAEGFLAWSENWLSARIADGRA